MWPVSAAPSSRTSVTQTSNSQYGQWFDASRRSSSSSVVRHVNVTPSRQYEHPASAMFRSDASMSRDQLASRDQPVMSSSPSCDGSFPHVSDSREMSWRPVTLPLSLQRSSTTLGRLATSASGMDSMSGQSHADLIRDYQRYRQLQASITGDKQTVWRGTSRLLTRPTAGGNVEGQTVSPATSNIQSPSTGSGSTEQQQQRQTETVTTTVVPLPLGVAGPLPLQRSVGNVVSACRLPADIAARRNHTSLTSPPSNTTDATVQLGSVVLVRFA